MNLPPGGSVTSPCEKNGSDFLLPTVPGCKHNLGHTFWPGGDTNYIHTNKNTHTDVTILIHLLLFVSLSKRLQSTLRVIEPEDMDQFVGGNGAEKTKTEYYRMNGLIALA